MPIVEGMEADHHKYVVEALIDPEVVQRQSRIAFEKYDTSSVLHYHRFSEPCTNGDGTPKKHESYGNVKIRAQLQTEVNKPAV